MLPGRTEMHVSAPDSASGRREMNTAKFQGRDKHKFNGNRLKAIGALSKAWGGTPLEITVETTCVCCRACGEDMLLVRQGRHMEDRYLWCAGCDSHIDLRQMTMDWRCRNEDQGR